MVDSQDADDGWFILSHFKRHLEDNGSYRVGVYRCTGDGKT